MNNNNYGNWSRRKFVEQVAGAGAVFLLNPFISLAGNEKDDKVKKIIAKTIGIDAHNHMDVPFSSEQFKKQKYDLAGEMKTSGLTAICMTFCVDRQPCSSGTQFPVDLAFKKFYPNELEKALTDIAEKGHYHSDSNINF